MGQYAMDHPVNVLEQIAEWRLEGADEASGRSFFSTSEVDQLENGQRCYVIGRKGTGKSAICKYFETRIDYNRFCLKLSFKEFPFNLLYGLDDAQYTTPSQYISLWKFFIYSSIMSMMAKNHNIDQEIREKIESIYPSDDFEYISSRMQKWTKKSFGGSFFKIFSANYSNDVENIPLHEIWMELIPKMESIILSHIDSAKYFIVFDELDEDYRNFWDDNNRERYIPLILSLFKAVSSVRRALSESRGSVLPIVFLRDDIYELLTDPDKNKWEDNKIYLNWKADKLKQMLAFRIERAERSDSTNFVFEDAWDKIFQHKDIAVGTHKNDQKIFDFIHSLTHSRPRDFVRLLKECARSSLEQGHKRITADTIRGIEAEYSGHLRQELVNEISGLIPDIEKIFTDLSKLRKQRCKTTDFVNESENIIAIVKSRQDNLDSGKIAEILFHFSVIGNAGRDNRPYYKYQRNSETLSYEAPVVIHRGLLRSFNLN